MERQVPVGVSSRHVHLTQEHVEVLFGPGHRLTVYKPLTQKGEFAAEERVSLVGPKGVLKNVRVLGPTRPKTQVEIAITDGFSLGINAPIRQSGHIEDTPGVILKGPKGTLVLDKGVIVAQRHLHCNPATAKKMGLRDGQLVDIQADGVRPVVFKDVLVRVKDNFRLEFHIDTDEANAAGLKNNQTVTIVKSADRSSAAEGLREAL